MFSFILFRIGQLLALSLPLRIGYCLARLGGDLYYFGSKNDRRIVTNNLNVILGGEGRKTQRYTREVFRNFAKYLVDFFRFPKLTSRFIEKCITIEGREYVDESLSRGRGVIGLTAHLGNWELGGVVMAMLGYPVNAIAWTHKNTLVNNFFIRQRTIKGVKVIPVGIGVRRSFSKLAEGEMVALLGDVDFSHPGYGITATFFKRKAMIPKGPALIALKAGSPILPGFMVREQNDTFRLIFEPPIEYQPTRNVERDVKELTQRVSAVIEKYVRKYPTQWFMFNEVWKE